MSMPAMSYPPRPCAICAAVFTPRLYTQYVCSSDACQAERVARAKQRKAAERNYGELACGVCGVVVSKRTSAQVTCLAAACVKEHKRRSLWLFTRDEETRWDAPIPTTEAPVPADDTPRPVRLHDGTELEVVWAGDMVRHGERGGLLEPRKSLPSTVSDEAPGNIQLHPKDERGRAWSRRRNRRVSEQRRRRREVAA